MAGKTQIRKPIVAGQFYPEQHSLCIEQINEFLEKEFTLDNLPADIVAAIVPHAGWIFSGDVAVSVFDAIRQQCEKVNTFIIFGASHSYYSSNPAVYDAGLWQTPVGDVTIDHDLAEKILATKKCIRDISAHSREHSIEVQVPIIQYLFPGAKILPIITPASKDSVELGQAVGEIIKTEEKKIVCIGSTDLTHYGPRYGFTPKGIGSEGLQWAKNVNDQGFIDLALAIKSMQMLEKALADSSACGPGAAAAAAAVARALGVEKAVLLAHTHSNDVMIKKMGVSSEDSVGYAGIIF